MGTYALVDADYTSPQTSEASKFLQHLFGTFIRDPSCGLVEAYGLPTYKLNRTTLIELFADNEPTVRLAAATEKAACANPTPVPPY